MVKFTILAGGFSTFIASYLFDSDANTLSLIGQFPSGNNPSWLALHPTNKSILYATNENEQGAIQSFVVKADGTLTEAIAETPSDGNGPAFAIPLSTGEVAAMNFGSGNGLVIPTEEDPLQFVSGAPLITFPPPLAAEGGASHPHMALEVGSEIFVPDLGADTVWRLGPDGAAPGAYKLQGRIDQPLGSGPRHIVVRGDQLYTVHEKASTLTQQTIPPLAPTPDLSAPSDPAPPPLLTKNVSVVPPDLPAGAQMFAAEVLLAEAGAGAGGCNETFIYVSNRNLGTPDPRGDAIAIFRVDPELALVKHVFTGLEQIRGMALSGGGKSESESEDLGLDGEDEDGNAFLVAGGVAGSAGVVVMRRTACGADLEIVASNAEVPTRSSFVWIEDF